MTKRIDDGNRAEKSAKGARVTPARTGANYDTIRRPVWLSVGNSGWTPEVPVRRQPSRGMRRAFTTMR